MGMSWKLDGMFEDVDEAVEDGVELADGWLIVFLV